MAPQKRKSTDGGSKAKAAKNDKDDMKVPVDALLKPQVKAFDKWLHFGFNLYGQKVFLSRATSQHSHSSLHCYLEEKLGTKAWRSKRWWLDRVW